MGLFNDKQIEAMFGGGYTCSKCGAKMVFEDKWEDTLVCNNCGHSVALELYGAEDEEDYDSLYPRQEDVADDED